jgi:beta-galactosidase GanA
MILSLFAASIALNPYGACAHITGHEHPVAQKTCEMMRQAGMGWVRSDFHWHSVEKKKGVWDFTAFDKVLAESEAEGVQLLPILGYSVS